MNELIMVTGPQHDENLTGFHWQDFNASLLMVVGRVELPVTSPLHDYN
jgi:hypothetical protein